jgi:hypothetical protein
MDPTIKVADLIEALKYLDTKKTMRQGRRDDFNVTGAGLGQTWYGNGLFSFCGDTDIVSLIIRDEALLNWLQWIPNNDIHRIVKAVTWAGPDGVEFGGQGCTSGAMTDICARPESVQWGKCEYRLGKGLYGRCGQPIGAMNQGLRYCNAEPIYRVNGTLIDNDAEWQIALAANVLKDDLSRDLIIGDSANDGEMDGLEKIIKTGYTDYRTGKSCNQLDSIVKDWANGDVDCSLLDCLAEIIERIIRRSKSVGVIDTVNDMALMVPTFLRNGLAKTAACCVSPCGSGAHDQAYMWVDGRQVRSDYNDYLQGGAFGDGWIPINGRRISFLINDWMPVASCPGGGANSYVTDMYVLVRRIGNRTVLRGEFQDLNPSAALMREYFGDSYRITDGGKFLLWSVKDNLCFKTCLITRPGLYLSAPWAQARITDVCCSMSCEKPESSEPCGTSGPDFNVNEYFPGWQTLYEAAPPEDFSA